VIEENGLGHVYLGVQWIFDVFGVKSNDEPDLDENIGGVPRTLKIVEDIFQAGGRKGT